MKQVFTAQRRYVELVQSVVIVSAGFASVGIIASTYLIDRQKFFGLMVFLLVLLILATTYPGTLEVDNGILYRRRFFKLWSINISSITDIMEGNTYAARLGIKDQFRFFYPNKFKYYFPQGLSFKITGGNFYQFPFGIVDTSALVIALKTANPSIEFHSGYNVAFCDGRGWKGDRRWRQTRIPQMLLNFVIFLLVLGIIWNI